MKVHTNNYQNHNLAKHYLPMQIINEEAVEEELETVVNEEMDVVEVAIDVVEAEIEEAVVVAIEETETATEEIIMNHPEMMVKEDLRNHIKEIRKEAPLMKEEAIDHIKEVHRETPPETTPEKIQVPDSNLTNQDQKDDSITNDQIENQETEKDQVKEDQMVLVLRNQNHHVQKGNLDIETQNLKKQVNIKTYSKKTPWFKNLV